MHLILTEPIAAICDSVVVFSTVLTIGFVCVFVCVCVCVCVCLCLRVCAVVGMTCLYSPGLVM